MENGLPSLKSKRGKDEKPSLFESNSTIMASVGNTTATNLSAATKIKDSVDTVTSVTKAQILQRTCPIHPGS